MLRLFLVLNARLAHQRGRAALSVAGIALGIALADPRGVTRLRLVTTVVAFKRLTADEIDRYLASGEWRGKAGGYAIQGRAAAFVRFLSGSYSNVVGLPLYETAALLEGAGYRCAALP